MKNVYKLASQSVPEKYLEENKKQNNIINPFFLYNLPENMGVPRKDEIYLLRFFLVNK